MLQDNAMLRHHVGADRHPLAISLSPVVDMIGKDKGCRYEPEFDANPPV